jgi:hypothetical protein
MPKSRCTAAGLLAALVLVLAGCASSDTSSNSASDDAERPAASAAAPSAMSCTDQAIAWRDSGGKDQLQALADDLQKVSAAGDAGDLGGVQGAITTLADDSQTGLANLPPRCIPGMRGNYRTALRDFIAAAESANDGTVDGISTSAMQVEAGGKAILRANAALVRFEGNS